MARLKGWLEALVLVASAGCSRLIESGIIAEKRYEPEREFSRSQMAVIIPPAFVEVKYIDDEDYVLVVSSKDKKGREIKRDIYVTKEVYETLKEGDAFDGSQIPHEDADEHIRKYKLPKRD